MKNTEERSVGFSVKQRKMFRLFDGCVAVAGILASMYTLYWLPYGSVYYGNRSEGDIGVFITLMIIVGVQAWLALSALTLWPGQTQVSKSIVKRPFWYQLSCISVILIWLSALPWTLTHLSSEGPWLIWLFALPLMLALGVLFGALAWLFGTIPLNMLVRGLYAFIFKRDRDAAPLLVIASMFLSMSVLIIVMPMAVETGHSGQAGYPSMIAAMAGLPGDYRVENETAFIAGRIAAVVALVTIILWLAMSNARKVSVQQHVDSGFTAKIEAPKRKKKQNGTSKKA